MSAALPAIAVGLAAFQAYGQYKAGRAQAKGLARQAAMEQLQGRGEALKYREQAVATMDRVLRTQATINARAGAGSIDPFSGSALAMQDYAIAEGANEIYVSKDNEIVAREGGLIRSAQLMRQSKSAYQAGIFQAVGTLGSAAFSYSRIGGAPSGGGTPSNTAGTWT